MKIKITDFNIKYKMQLLASFGWLYVAYLNKGDNASMIASFAVALIILSSRNIEIRLDEIEEEKDANIRKNK